MFEARSTTTRARQGSVPRVLERLVAAIVLVGLLLWGASLVATPDREADESVAPSRSEIEDEPAPIPDEEVPPPPSDAGEDDDDDDGEEEAAPTETKGDRRKSDRGPG